MRKIISLVILIILLCGCHKSMGSFTNGDMDMVAFYEKLNQKTMQDEWRFPLLNEQYLEKAVVEETHHIDMTKLKDSNVVQAIVPMEMGELSFFKTDSENDRMIQEALQSYKTELKQKWQYMKGSQNIIEQALEGRIGQYYYFIIGEDNQKVVDYIRDFER